MNPSKIQKGNSICSYFRKVSAKCILLSFLGLVVFAFVNLLSSTSTLSTVVVDMSIRMKGNVVEVLSSLVDLSTADSINGTISFAPFPAHENERFPDRSVMFDFTEDKQRYLFKNSSEGESTKETGRPAETKELNSSNELGSNLTSMKGEKNNETNGKNGKNFSSKMKEEINKYGNRVNTTVNKRQSNCESCFQHTFNYVIQNERICNLYSPNDGIDLLILVFTTHKNFRARSALRSTWLSYTRNNTGNVRYAFMLGETRDSNLKEAVFEENQHFHDILKEDFIDTYMNLTYKTIMGFKWAATQCAHARYVMKTDDDMFVNVPNLLKVFKGPDSEVLEYSIIGACSQKARPNRNKNSKWFASEYSYPEKYYPGFCSGTGYVTSMRVATAVFKISPSVPFFHLEDVYVSLCVKKLGFKLKAFPGFNPGRPKIDPCIYKGEKLITAHQLTPIMLQLIWHRQCMKMRINL